MACQGMRPNPGVQARPISVVLLCELCPGAPDPDRWASSGKCWGPLNIRCTGRNGGTWTERRKRNRLSTPIGPVRALARDLGPTRRKLALAPGQIG